MKKIIFILLLLFILVGCGEKSTSELVKLEESDYEKIEVARNIEEILEVLPGNLNIKGVETPNENRLVVKYNTGVKGIEKIEEYDSYWEKYDSYKKILLFNASIIFSENKALKDISFYLETNGMIYTVYVKRDSIEKYIISDLASLEGNIAKIESDLITPKSPFHLR